MGVGTRVGRVVNAALRDLLDAVLDRRCPGCAGPVERDEQVCATCDAAIDRVGSVLCLACLHERGGAPGGDAVGENTLRGAGAPSDAPRGGCPHGASRLLLTGPPHVPPLDAIIRAFKYEGAERLAPWVASLVPTPPGLAGPLGREALLVPVPLHPARRAARGFDQAALLAESLGRWWGVPVAHALRRARETRPQARLSAEARRANLRGAFALAESALPLLSERPLFLVDDVATTGTTLLEAAGALALANPRVVIALAASHGGSYGAAQSPLDASVATA